MNEFKSRIKTIKYDFVLGSLPSGAVCFFGSVFMSLAQLGYISNMDELFTLASCYILLDHYLDDKSVDIHDKVKTINQIKEFINGNFNKIENPILRAVTNRYKIMVNNVPTAEPYLKNLFKAETKTMLMQRSSDLCSEEYLYICEWKGGSTCEAIQALIGLEVTQAEYDLGACIQLVDDMMDINDDIDLGIHTIATHSHSIGLLDKLFEYIVNRLDGLDRKYNLFKPVLYIGLLLSIHINRDKYDSVFLNKIDPYIHFKSSTTKDSLVNWFQSHLDK